MAETVSVRRAKTTDVFVLQRFINRCWLAAYEEMLRGTSDERKHFSHWYVFRSMIGSASTRDWNSTLIAWHENEVVGYISATSPWFDRTSIDLWMLYVAPELQGQGVGTMLLRAVVDSLPLGQTMRLEVVRRNTTAIEWYMSRGFKIYRTSPKSFHGSAVDVHYMECTVSRQ